MNKYGLLNYSRSSCFMRWWWWMILWPCKFEWHSTFRYLLKEMTLLCGGKMAQVLGNMLFNREKDTYTCLCKGQWIISARAEQLRLPRSNVTVHLLTLAECKNDSKRLILHCCKIQIYRKVLFEMWFSFFCISVSSNIRLYRTAWIFINYRYLFSCINFMLKFLRYLCSNVASDFKTWE